MRLRDVVLFNITAIVGLRWLTTAASQFGLASLLLWVVAMLVFFLPSAVAVRELADIDPGAGGIYRWVQRAFGLRHGFVAGWGYWVNNLFYFPSLLVATAAIAAYAGGPRFVHLGDDGRFIAVLSLVGLWLAVGMNVVGLRVGKRLQNLGGYGTWLPALIFVALATWSLVTRGSATRFSARGLLPSTFDLASINLFATMTFGLGPVAVRGGVGRRPARGVRPDPSALADALRRVAGAGSPRHPLRGREPDRVHGEKRVPRAHPDHADPVLHSLSVPLRGLPAAAAHPHRGYGADRGSGPRGRRLLHRARLRSTRRRGAPVEIRSQGGGRGDRVHGHWPAARAPRCEGAHSFHQRPVLG